MQREQREHLGVLHLLGDRADDRSVLEIAPLRSAGHEQMVLDHQPQVVRHGAIQAQPHRHPRRQPAADLRVLAVAVRLAGVMQQQRQVKDVGPLQALEQLRIMGVGSDLGLPDPVNLLQAHERVFVRGVLVIKLMLHQAGQPAELGNVFAEQTRLMHGAQDGRHVAALVQDAQKRLAHVLVVKKRAVRERQLVADELRQIRVQPQPALLRMQIDAHQPPGLIAKHPRGGRVNVAVNEFEAVHHLLACRRGGG